MRPAENNHGFTLIELLIYVGIFGVVLGSIFTAYQGQLKSQVVQREISDMQQNLRAALYLMEREIKLAGLNPSGAAGIGITTADPHRVAFSMDFTGGEDDGIDNDGDGLIDNLEWYDGAANHPNETVNYVLSNDPDAVGINSGLPTESNSGAVSNLLRNGDVIAMNIDALNFVYLDRDGTPIASPVAGADMGRIRAIQITVVARSGERPSTWLRGVVDNRNYLNQQGEEILPQQNDAFRRLMLTTEVKCRNLGL
jgi:type IV pilus assembly protein PilW